MTAKGEMSAKTTYQRSAKGPVTIPECSPDGKFVVVENTGRKVFWRAVELSQSYLVQTLWVCSGCNYETLLAWENSCHWLQVISVWMTAVVVLFIAVFYLSKNQLNARTIGHISRLDLNPFRPGLHFGWDSAPAPIREAYDAPALLVGWEGVSLPILSPQWFPTI